MWLQNVSKWFPNKKLLNWENLASIPVNIQALLTCRNYGRRNRSRSKFNSIPFYELFLKITTYSIYEWSIAIAHVGRMPQFQTFIKSCGSPLNTQTLILVVFIDATISMLSVLDKWLGGKCTLNNQCMLHFWKITLIILIVDNFNTSSLLLETVKLKVSEARIED